MKTLAPRHAALIVVFLPCTLFISASRSPLWAIDAGKNMGDEATHLIPPMPLGQSIEMSSDLNIGQGLGKDLPQISQEMTGPEMLKREKVANVSSNAPVKTNIHSQDATISNAEVSQRESPSKNPLSLIKRFLFKKNANNIGTPPGFGAPDGIEIANKDTLLKEIDHALGMSQPPALEMIWVRPFPMVKILNKGLGTNPFGHTLVRYTMPDGTQKIMNIVGVKGHQMVNFVKPEDYLYSTHGFILASDKGKPDYQNRAEEQGGVYNRGMVSLRIEKLPPETITHLDSYYQNLKTLADAGKDVFSLAGAEIKNKINQLLGNPVREGNCALWSSTGYAVAGILKSPSFWPKNVWVKLYEKYKKIDPDNVHVVSYRHIKQAVQTFSPDVDMNGLVTPFNIAKNIKYWNLERFADLLVEVPRGSITAQIRRVTPKS